MQLRSTGTMPTPPWHAETVTGTTSFALRFTGYLYAVGLRDAVADLIARHEPLRTVESAAAHLVLAPEAAPIPDLVPVLVTPGELSRAVDEFVTGPAPTVSAAPVRARSFRVLGGLDDPAEHLLVLVISTHVTDRISPARLARDLMTAYAARRRNLPPTWSLPRPVHPLHVHELRRVELIEDALSLVEQLATAS
ncbi:hypothetical protein ACWDSJ_14400 [Nocardia sp. NPDC003482]